MNNILYRPLKTVLRKAKRFFPFIDPDQLCYAFIRRNFSNIIGKYKALSQSDFSQDKYQSTKRPIYTCWWQGYDSAPPIVKKCIDSMRRNAGDREVIVITFDNWNKYIELPKHILEKVQAKNISLTHFSDILRMSLIAETGGLWLDATVYTPDRIPESYFAEPFFTVHYPASRSAISNGKWTGYCMGAHAQSPLHSFSRDIFYEYWKNNSALIEYFFIDYVIAFAYSEIPVIRDMIDSVPINNIGIKRLDEQFNSPYDPNNFNAILNSSVFFKLSWKRKYQVEIDEAKTNYGYFINS